MKKNLIAIVAFSVVMTACGGSDADKDKAREEAKAKDLAEAQAILEEQQAARKPVTPENLAGKWEIVSTEPASDLVGKVVEFTPDSIFHYDEKGQSIHNRVDYRVEEEKINIWKVLPDGESADSQTLYFQGEELVFISPVMKTFHMKKMN